MTASMSDDDAGSISKSPDLPPPPPETKFYNKPPRKRKLIRVLTVIAYVFFVSLAAILLSLYYLFIWDPNPGPHSQRQSRLDPTNGTHIPRHLPVNFEVLPSLATNSSSLVGETVVSSSMPPSTPSSSATSTGTTPVPSPSRTTQAAPANHVVKTAGKPDKT